MQLDSIGRRLLVMQLLLAPASGGCQGIAALAVRYDHDSDQLLIHSV